MTAGKVGRGEMRAVWTSGLAAAIAVVGLLALGPAALAQSPGAAGAGDPYFPLMGNGGYEVDHYDLNLRVRPKPDKVKATATISATATQALSSFNLDFRGLRVTSASVNGFPAALSRRGGEMTVTPAAPLASGASFTVAIAYHGRPRPIGGIGWIRTHDGTTAFSEPNGSPSWFPCNDHPSDKASYSFTVTVPPRYRAIANGLLDSVQHHGGATTFAWHEPQPMATYLATVTIGHFRIKPSLVDGLPAWTAVAPGEGKRSRRSLRKLPRIIGLYGDHFGGYPFSSAGSIVIPGKSEGALETQTKPVYLGAPVPVVVAHETAHQWFGDAVSLAAWQDIWLNEGFATWSQWMWQAQAGDARLRNIFENYFNTSFKSIGVRHFWKLPPGAPGPKKLFSFAVYYRGGMTLEALREKVGDVAFYATLRDWVAQHKYGNGTTQQFIALAEADSGVSLAHFFDLWLFQPRKPKGW
jgi:aminopeptidase N